LISDDYIIDNKNNKDNKDKQKSRNDEDTNNAKNMKQDGITSKYLLTNKKIYKI